MDVSLQAWNMWS
ncbi:unnamed protein product, partial [Allacma fusca]